MTTPKTEDITSPPCEPRTIYLRGFVPSEAKKRKRRRRRAPKRKPHWTLIFDTETTIDASQKLRIGAYQVRQKGKLREEGLFYDPEALSSDETELLNAVASENLLPLMTVRKFADEVFFGVGYDLRAEIVGFNLPFDLSRLAIAHAPARGQAVKGGFSFKLSSDRWRPRVQVRHLSARAAFIQFTHPHKRRDARRERKAKMPQIERRGAFVDVKTLGSALTSRSFSLAGLAKFLQIPSQKLESEGHGRKLSRKYMEYLRRDVQATWECFEALEARFLTHKLTGTHVGKIYSEASVGKAYLQQMEIRPHRESHPDFPDRLTGIIMSTYFGGRSEVRWRRTPRQVLYCDFLSMYPTVCTLMGLWSFIIGRGMTWRDETAIVQTFLDEITVDNLQNPDTWKLLTTLAKIQPDADILPVRAKYSGISSTIGLNYLTSSEPMWFTLADIIASKILAGKSPRIIEAIRFIPGEPQPNLKPISIGGNSDYQIDPAIDDFFKHIIDRRAEVKNCMKAATGPKRDELDSEQQALKILANSTSYGIFIEFNVHKLDRREKRKCLSARGEEFDIETDKIEEPGSYFNALLATLITGAARLMLATAERLTLDAGLDWAFCDTDSIAVAKPENMAQAEFFFVAKRFGAGLSR